MAVPDRAGAEGSEVGKDNSTATRGFEELPGYGRPIAVITLTNRLDDKGSQFVGPAVGAPQTPAALCTRRKHLSVAVGLGLGQ